VSLDFVPGTQWAYSGQFGFDALARAVEVASGVPFDQFADDGELDGNRFLGRKSVDLMRSAFIPDSLPGRTAGEGHGLGVRVVTDRTARSTLLSNGSFGWSGAFNTHFFIDPEKNVIGIFMTQSQFLATRQQPRDDFETAVMQALVGDAPTY
jgi:CubicO group peptidase (beta-lactamase class C family)